MWKLRLRKFYLLAHNLYLESVRASHFKVHKVNTEQWSSISLWCFFVHLSYVIYWVNCVESLDKIAQWKEHSTESQTNLSLNSGFGISWFLPAGPRVWPSARCSECGQAMERGGMSMRDAKGKDLQCFKAGTWKESRASRKVCNI